MNNIIEYLDELFPNPRCELNYNKDYELLIAIMLSAQTTDKRVNKVTKILFNKYPDVLEYFPLKPSPMYAIPSHTHAVAFTREAKGVSPKSVHMSRVESYCHR